MINADQVCAKCEPRVHRLGQLGLMLDAWRSAAVPNPLIRAEPGAARARVESQRPWHAHRHWRHCDGRQGHGGVRAGASNRRQGYRRGNTGGGSSACPGADANEFATVSGWLSNTIAWARYRPTLQQHQEQLPGRRRVQPARLFDRDELCRVRADGDQLAAQVRGGHHLRDRGESSYNPASVVYDSYAGSTDPTVGLLQDRFSSTRAGLHYNGPWRRSLPWLHLGPRSS